MNSIPFVPYGTGEEELQRVKRERDRLQMLLTIALIAVDMPAAKPDEPWVRLVEAAHAHGRKLQREEDAAALRERAKYALDSSTTELEAAADAIEARR